MKKKILTVLAVLAAALLCFILYTGIVWSLSDRVVQIGFRGLDNMFMVRDEYTAIAGRFRARVPGFLVQTLTDEKLGNITNIDEETGRNFFVQATWSPNGRPTFEGTTTLIHAYDAKYVFEVNSPGPDKADVTRDEERIMLEVAEHFHDFSEPYVYSEGNWLAGNKNHMTFLSYHIYFHGDKVLLCISRPRHEDTLFSYDNGEFTEIMDVPEKGDFDWVIWKD